ncbi:hypothetical protein [Microbulbifer sp. ALW1]|uniref:hypothetical protein n=1 Tax=Microbulbifer sp. (strain ALW1) TaxID=1516059 RepID=UPI00135ACB62|nr:hypothetical protein [Microbulbifer sp. ALW1]
MNIYEQRRAYALETAKTYALIRNEIANRQRYGEQVPPQLYQQLQKLETEAQELLPPQMLQQAVQIANGFESELNRHSEQQYQELEQAEITKAVDRAAGKLSSTMSTEKKLNGEQFSKVIRGEKVKLPTGKPTFDTKSIEQMILKGTGKSFEKRVKELDHLEQIKRSRSEEEYQAALESYKATPEQVDVWEQHGMRLLMLKREAENRKDDPEFEEWQPDDKSVRKAQVADSYMEHNHEIPVSEEIHDSYLNHTQFNDKGEEEPSRLADVARAFDYHEKEALNG